MGRDRALARSLAAYEHDMGRTILRAYKEMTLQQAFIPWQAFVLDSLTQQRSLFNVNTLPHSFIQPTTHPDAAA